MYKLVTKSPVNIRSGPGMAFETIDSLNEGTLLESWEYKKDGSNTGWYKTEKGWVCANYVSLSTEMYSEVKDFKTIGRVVQSAGDTASGMTESVTAAERGASGVSSAAGGGIVPGIGEMDYGGDMALARRAFGIPYQFMKNTDVRPGGPDAELGLDMKQSILEAPMISLCAGKPFFLPEMTPDERKTFVQGIEDQIKSTLVKPYNIGGGSAGDDIKYFDFQPDPHKFFDYANTVAKMFAVYLGIGGEPVPGAGGITFHMMDWSNYTLANLFAGRATTNSKMKLGLSNLIGQTKDVVNSDNSFAGKVGDVVELTSKEPYYVDFFINPRVSYSESFTNSTKDSMLAGMVQQGSDLAKEFAFMVAAGTNYTDNGESYQKMQENIQEAVNGYNGNAIIKRILGGASSIISGNNMIFPKIWGGSEYSKSYTVDISLKSPYGDKISVFMNILLPLAFLLSFTLPRQHTVNTYGSPFIVQGYLPGFCAIDMGMVSSLTISKGGDGGDAWSVDGLPLQMDIQLNIEDLYHNMMLSGIINVGMADAYNLLWNSGLIDYVSINSGVPLKQTNKEKIFELLAALVENTPTRVIEGMNRRLQQVIPSVMIRGLTAIRGGAGSILGNIGL